MMTQSILKKYNFARIDIDDKYIILSDSEEDVQKNSSRSYLRNVKYRIKENNQIEISGNENIYSYADNITPLEKLDCEVHPKYIKSAYSPKSIFSREKVEDYKYVQYTYIILTNKLVTYTLPLNQFVIKEIQTL